MIRTIKNTTLRRTYVVVTAPLAMALVLLLGAVTGAYDHAMSLAPAIKAAWEG